MEKCLKPFEEYLSQNESSFRDGKCGEPVMWGYKITRKMPEDLFEKLRYDTPGVFLKCEQGRYPYYSNTTWYAITRTLTRSKAIKKYGAVTNEEFGPRGGWRSVTFGDKTFESDCLKESKVA